MRPRIKKKKKGEGQERTCSQKSADLVYKLNFYLDRYAKKHGLKNAREACVKLGVPLHMKNCTAKQLSGFYGFVKSKMREA